MNRHSGFRLWAALAGATLVATLTLAAQPYNFTPKTLPENADLVNPLSGFYTWLHKSLAPTSGPPLTAYQRFAWAQLERAPDQFDFSPIDKELAQLPKGGQFGFRVFALNGGFSWANGVDVPQYLTQRLQKAFYIPADQRSVKYSQNFVPDWNDPYFLDRVDRLMNALGAKYDGDPRIAWVDVGIYGNWGEWHLSGLPNFPRGRIPYEDAGINPQGAQPGTMQTKQRIIDAHTRAFPRTRLIMMTDDKAALAYALRQPTTIPIGLRRDSWGNTHFSREMLSDDMAGFDKGIVSNRWKTAPFIVESFGGAGAFEAGAQGLVDQIEKYHVALVANGGFASNWNDLPPRSQQAVQRAGLRAGYRFSIAQITIPEAPRAGRSMTIQTRWVNSGVTPAYQPWRVELSLIPPNQSKAAATVASTVDLEHLLPNAQGETVTDTLPLPPDLQPGRYDLQVRVVDPGKYRLPMQLANDGKTASGAYIVGNVNVGPQ